MPTQWETKLTETIQSLRNASANPERVAPDISAWPVGVHVQHCAQVMVKVCDALAASSDQAPPRKWSLPRLIVLSTGFIPRGKGKAPKEVTPDAPPDADLSIEWQAKAERVAEIALTLPKTRWFMHPLFGSLGRDEAIKFLAIHNRHHLKIIQDIERE